MSIENKESGDTELVKSIITEGKAKVCFEGPVFYNPVQEFNRDLTVTVLREFVSEYKNAPVESVEPPVKKKKVDSRDGTMRILDALSASGLRALRFAQEVPGVDHVTANDFSENAVESIKKNITLNNLEGKITAHFGDAIMTMMEHRTLNKRFHAVDLDPYGSASVFLDSAVQCVADEGLLMVTCTDMAVLCGNTPEACYNKYGSVTVRAKCCHEMALRILLRSIDSHANKYSRYIEPLIAVSIDFYVRVFVRLHTSPKCAKDSATKTGNVLVCSGCHSMEELPLLRKTVEGTSVRFTTPTMRPRLLGNDSKCVHCDHTVHQAGPLYLAPITNKQFVEKILQTLRSTKEEEKLGTHNRLLGVLSTVAEEIDNPFYYEVDQLANTVKTSVPRQTDIRSALLNAGYKVSGTHCSPKGIKTNAPLQFIWDMYRTLVKNAKSEKKLDPNSAGFMILNQPTVNEIDFKLNSSLVLREKKEKMVRYQCNKGKNWGPRQKAKGSVNSKQAGFQNVELNSKKSEE